jgi:hypothetical protein
MDTIIIVVVVVALVAIAVAAFAVAKRRRPSQLQQQFGSEYQRTVDEAGDRGTAEKDSSSASTQRGGGGSFRTPYLSS